MAKIDSQGLRAVTSAGFEKQAAFGGVIAWAIFLGGAGGGTFLISYLLKFLYGFEFVSKIGMFLGPLIAIACTSCFMVDLENRAKMPKLFSSLSRLTSSWLLRGAWVLLIFIIFALAYSLPYFEAFSWLPWGKASALSEIFGIIAAVFSVTVLMYTGFLLGVVKSVPFWNTPLLPILFITSGLGSGLAVTLLVAAIGKPAAHQELVTTVHTVGLWQVAFILVQLVLLWAYLGVAIHQDVESAQSVRLIRGPIIGIIIGGLLVPIALSIYSLLITDISAVITYDTFAALLELSGAFFLRYSILNAGLHRKLLYA